jgi:hypothetical protein
LFLDLFFLAWCDCWTLLLFLLDILLSCIPESEISILLLILCSQFHCSLIICIYIGLLSLLPSLPYNFKGILKLFLSGLLRLCFQGSVLLVFFVLFLLWRHD